MDLLMDVTEKKYGFFLNINEKDVLEHFP